MQSRPAVTARQLLAYVWAEVLGRRASALARALGQTRGNISTAARRGAVQAARWQAEIPRRKRRGTHSVPRSTVSLQPTDGETGNRENPHEVALSRHDGVVSAG